MFGRRREPEEEVCFELVNKMNEDTELSIIKLIEGFTASCPKALLRVESVASNGGVRSFIRVLGDSTCVVLLEALLRLNLPLGITFRRVSCPGLNPKGGFPSGVEVAYLLNR